jgi:hypothetical protein
MQVANTCWLWDTPIVFEDFVSRLLPFDGRDISSEVQVKSISEQILRNIAEDYRLLPVRDVDSGSTVFVPDRFLFRWFLSVVLRLSDQGGRQLTRSQLECLIAGLNHLGPWRLEPSRIVGWARKYGFIEESAFRDVFVSPLAEILMSCTPEVKRHLVACLEFLTETGARLQTLDCTPEYWINQLLSRFDERTTLIIRSREPFSFRNQMVLEELGGKLGLTRERVRQLEAEFWRKVKSCRSLYQTAVCGFFSEWVTARCSRIQLEDCFSQLFFAKAAGVPIGRVSFSGVCLIGGLDVTIPHRELKVLPEPPDDSLACLSKYAWHDRGLRLSAVDNERLCRPLMPYAHKKFTLPDKVTLVLRSIGKPAHFSEVTSEFRLMFPGEDYSSQSIEGALRRCTNGVVWVGMKGTYALEEWGHRRPQMGLMETVARIVSEKHAETGRSVHINTIMNEVSKTRPITKGNSIRIAAERNPSVRKVSKDYFVPLSDHDVVQVDEDIEALDRILRKFETDRDE